jgi:hypothetical protein
MDGQQNANENVIVNTNIPIQIKDWIFDIINTANNYLRLLHQHLHINNSEIPKKTWSVICWCSIFLPDLQWVNTLDHTIQSQKSQVNKILFNECSWRHKQLCKSTCIFLVKTWTVHFRVHTLLGHTLRKKLMQNFIFFIKLQWRTDMLQGSIK